MPEYNIGFSEKLIEAAKVVAESAANSADGQRTVLYLSLLSSEIALKAFLESAGVTVKEIARCSHSHEALLDAMRNCEVIEEIIPGNPAWVAATRVRAISVVTEAGTSTVGTLLSLEPKGASKYPNEIRYGNSVSHVPAEAMLQASEKLYEWVVKHLECARQKQQGTQSPNAGDSDNSDNSYRRRDTLAAAITFCKAHGGDLRVGDELKFSRDERDERGQDYWIGYRLVDSKGSKHGEITSGYIGYISNPRLYAAINIDGEVIESEAQTLDKISSHNRERNEQPKELKALLIKIAERATRKANRLRGL